MLTNASCTLYLAAGKDRYQRFTAEAVHWEDTRAANINKTGSTAVDSIAVYIPFSSLPSSSLPGKASGRDYIIRGIVEDDPETVPIRDIVAGYEAFTVTSVKKCDYGSLWMQHWELGAK